jgi:integrase
MRKPGRKAYGYRPGERKVVNLIWRKRLPRKGPVKGETKIAEFREIADELNTTGYRTRMGLLWYAAAVRRIWEREKAERDRKRQPRSTRSNYGPGDYLSDAAINKCLAVGRGQEELIFRLLLISGLRASELCGIRRRDVVLDRGEEAIHILYAKNTRGGEGVVKTYNARWVYLSLKIGDLLRRHIESRIPPLRAGDPIFVNSWGHPLTYKNLYNRIKKIGRIAEVESIKPHRLRHSCATIFLNSKGSAANLQSHLGHKDFRTTKIYAKSLKTAIQRDVEATQKAIDNIELSDNTE